jgi:hypothetical protein
MKNKGLPATPSRAGVATSQYESERPVFIVGAPRSGTSLLRRLLNRHPSLAISSETDFNHYVYARRQSFGSLADRQHRERLVDAYLATQHIRRLQVDLQGLREALLAEGTSYEAFFASLLRFYARTQGKARWGEKTPRHAFLTESLCQWYPGASIVHLVRDPRDVVASLRRLPTEPHSVVGGGRLWVACNRAAHRSAYRPQYLLVRYEHLAAEPENELRRICSFLDEEYSPAMLAPDGDPAGALPWYRRAEEAVTTARLEKWREDLTREEVALVEWVAGAQMKAFGYRPVGETPARLAVVRAAAVALFDAVRQRIVAFPAVWYYLIKSTDLVKEESARERFTRQPSGGAA